MKLQTLGDPGMQRPASPAQEGPVSRGLHQGVLEEIGRIRRRAPPRHEPGLKEPVERRRQLRFRQTRHEGHERMRELPPNRRADLRNRFGRTQPVETRHQRRVQAGRDGERRRGDPRDRARRRAFALRLQHRLRHLLCE